MNEDGEREKYITSLFKLAKKDLKASKSLFKGELYQQSVFSLQQSVEKSTKSIGLYFSIIEVRDLNKGPNRIGHQNVKIFQKFTDTLNTDIVNFKQNIKKYPEVEEFFGYMRDDFKKLEYLFLRIDEFVDSLVKDKAYKIYLSGEELEELLNNLNTLDKLHREFRSFAATPEYNVTVTQMKDSLTEKLEEIVPPLKVAFQDINKKEMIKEDLDQMIEKLVAENFDEDFVKTQLSTFVDIVYSSISLLYLSVILQPHSTARYPEGNFDPNEFYTEELPLIRKLPYLLDFSEKSLSLLDKYDLCKPI